PFAVELKAGGTSTGLIIERLAVNDVTNMIFSGQGSLPIIVDPGRPGAVIHVETQKPIEFRAATKPNRNFWAEISKWTHFTLQEPSIELAVSGTLESPQGHVAVSVASLEIPSRDAGRKL